MIESKLIPKALFSDKSVKSVNNLKDYAGIEYIASMNQTHSDIVTFVKSSAVYDSDGIYTEEPKLGLVVQTADCMPILLSDKKRIGAIHSVIFGGFAPDSIAGRIQDCQSQFIITSDEGVRGGKLFH